MSLFKWSGLIATSVLLVSSLTVSASSKWPTNGCPTKNILQWVDKRGCLINDIKNSHKKADLGVRIFPATNAGNIAIEGNVVQSLRRTLVYIGGYHGSELGFVEFEELEKLRRSGVSIVVIKTGAAGDDTIEQNVDQVARVIKDIDRFRKGISGSKYMSIMGYSTGGVIARRVLNKLEAEGYDHQFKTYVSFDAPHTGLHIPAAITDMDRMLDYWFREIPKLVEKHSRLIDVPLAPINLVMNAARSEMKKIHAGYVNKGMYKQLVYGEDMYKRKNDTRWHDQVTTDAYHEMRKGNPKKTRNIAVSNGSVSYEQLGYIGTRSTYPDPTISFSVKTHKGSHAELTLNIIENMNEQLIANNSHHRPMMNAELKLIADVVMKESCFFFICWPTVKFPWQMEKLTGSGYGMARYDLDRKPGAYSPNIAKALQMLTKVSNDLNAYEINSPYWDADAKEVLAITDANAYNFNLLPTQSALGLLPVKTTKDIIHAYNNPSKYGWAKIIINGERQYGGFTNENLDHLSRRMSVDTVNELRSGLGLSKI